MLPRKSFRKIVRKHNSDKWSKGNDSWHQLVSMLFCHFGQCSSLTDISFGLKSSTGDLNHLGLSHSIPKSSLGDVNAKRDWRLFRDYYFALLDHFASDLNVNRQRLRVRIKRKIFIADTSIISLCLSVFDWAVYRQQKGAIKLHTILDMDVNLPSFMHVSDGKQHDNAVIKGAQYPKGSVLVADRAFFLASWLNILDSRRVNFVIRVKANLKGELIESYDISEERSKNLDSDMDIYLSGQHTSKDYPNKLRLVEFFDSKGNRIEVVTNNFQWSASTVAELYRHRWEIEVFFKQIKQHLKIKTFVGTSPNAVKIQLWTAMIVILLLKVIKTKAKYKWNLSNLSGFIRLNLFTKISLQFWLDNPIIKSKRPPPGTQIKIAF